MSEKRTTCHTPTPGKKPTTIPSWKYDLIREVILEIVPAKEPGIAGAKLAEHVAERLPADAKKKLGSIQWHTTAVRLNMEVEGELARIPKVRPQHLVRLI